MNEYILVRSDRDISLTYLFSSYSEQVNSETIEFKGQKYCGIRLKTEPARNVARCYGWKDITEEYNEFIQEQAEESNQVEEEPKKTTKTKKRTTRAKKK